MKHAARQHPELRGKPHDSERRQWVVVHRGELVAACSTLVNVQVERLDPESAFIGVPARLTDKRVWLEEVTSQAQWVDAISKWKLSEVTRVEFGSSYEDDLLLVAGPPPSSGQVAQ